MEDGVIDVTGNRPPTEEITFLQLMADLQSNKAPAESLHVLQALKDIPGRPKQAARSVWQEWIDKQLNAPAGGR